MKIQHERSSGGYIFNNGDKRTHFLFLLSDLSAFGNPVKKPMKIRGNYRKCMKLLLGNKINELELFLSSGEYFEVESPILSRGHTKEEVEEYNLTSGGDKMNVEPARLSISLRIPPGEAIKIYSIEEGFQVYLVNQGGVFYESNDFEAVEEATGVYF